MLPTDLPANRAANQPGHTTDHNTIEQRLNALAANANAHQASADPHGDRAYATAQVATRQPLDADLTAIAGIDSTTAGALATDGAGWVRKSWAQLRTALGLATMATSGRIADAADLSTPGAAVGGVLTASQFSGGAVDQWRVLRGAVNIQAYGASPAASPAANRAALQAAFDDLPSAGGEIVIPAGTYTCDPGASCAVPVVLSGAGHGSVTGGGSRLNFTATTGVALTLSARGSQVRDLTIERAAFLTSRATAGAGLRLASSTHCELNRVLIQGFWNNLECLAGEYYNITDCKILDFANYGIRLAHDESVDHGDQSITGCHIGKLRDTTAGGTAVYWTSGGGVRFQNNKINAGGQTDSVNTARLAKGIHLAIGNTTSTSVFPIVGNSIENFLEHGILITGTSGNIDKMVIADNELAGFGAASIGIETAQDSFIYSCNIHGNSINDCHTAIRLKRIRESVVSGNSGTAVTDYGIRVVEAVIKTDFFGNRWPGETIYPWYFDGTSYPPLSDNDYSTTLFLNSTTTPIDLFEIGCAQYGRVFVDVEISGGVDSVSANALALRRCILANANGQDAGQQTIGSDFSDGGGNMTAALVTAGLANPVARLRLTRSGGTNLNLTVKVRAYGQGLRYVRQLVAD